MAKKDIADRIQAAEKNKAYEIPVTYSEEPGRAFHVQVEDKNTPIKKIEVQVITPAESFISKTEEENDNRKRCVTFYCSMDLYRKIQLLASMRAAAGERNTNQADRTGNGEGKQPLSAAAVINEALEEYIQNHADQLAKFQKLQDELKG